MGENVKIIKEWIPNITEIGYFGGEPLLSDENLDILRYCVETGHSKHITILLNTNGTVYTDEIAMLFSKFKKVFLNFSIDDIGARFEYQRKGGNWDEVIDNMKKFIAHGGYNSWNVIECKICCTVTSMNIENLITYLDAHEEAQFDEFFSTIARHDKYRQESFQEIFPEFWEVIKQYKPDDIVMYETNQQVLA